MVELIFLLLCSRLLTSLFKMLTPVTISGVGRACRRTTATVIFSITPAQECDPALRLGRMRSGYDTGYRIGLAKKVIDCNGCRSAGFASFATFLAIASDHDH